MIEAAIDNLEAKMYDSFSHSWTFTSDLTGITFYGEIRDLDGTLKDAFTVSTTTNDVLISLTRAEVEAIGTGSFFYSIKQVEGTTEFAVIEGKFKIGEDTTQIP